MNDQLIVIIMPYSNKDTPYVYDVIDRKDTQHTIAALHAVLCDNDDDDEYSCFDCSLNITYEQYSISIGTCHGLVPGPKWYRGGYVIFVDKEKYTVHEILQTIQVH